MRILCISDLHSQLKNNEIEVIKAGHYDLCLCLGDIPKQALDNIISNLDVPIMGVMGNHDDPRFFDGLPIINLHNKNVGFGNLRFAGIEGSNRYKQGNYVMHSQEEIHQVYRNLQKADILVSHDTGYQYLGKDNAHIGFKGISKYIFWKRPKLHIFGHYHQPMKFKKGSTTCICVYRCCLIDTDIKEFQQLF